jgi:hypothetical protein
VSTGGCKRAQGFTASLTFSFSGTLASQPIHVSDKHMTCSPNRPAWGARKRSLNSWAPSLSASAGDDPCFAAARKRFSPTLARRGTCTAVGSVSAISICGRTCVC